VNVAVVGQGSIGRRHTAILLELGHDVVAYDPDPSTPTSPEVQVARSVRDCLRGAEAAVIASPSSEHPGHARAAIELGVPVLVEKPLALDAARAAELDVLARERATMLSVAMNLREHAGVLALSELIGGNAVGQILRASARCGSWLPGWRAGSDYRDSYSARAELGGGVLLDVAAHELDYLLWLAGRARSVTALAGKISQLETDVEDVALISLELDSGALAQISVDYVDRAYTRGCRIVGSEGTLDWSWEDERLIHHYASGAPAERPIASDVAPTYHRQLERFLAAVAAGADAPVPAADARHVLAVIDAARASARDGRRVTLAPSIALRPAGVQDRDRLRAWRNDPDTRRWSRSSHEIAAEEHAAWFTRVLADTSTRLWIAECAGRPIAHVRVGPESEGAAEVHVVLAPEARGQGLGSAVLAEAGALALASADTDLLCAYIKPEHAASLRAFTRAGFSRAGADDDGLLRFERGGAGSTRAK
jgi:predicted dehydrogenase/RimJ/RimL family protein N-acetyltransferase